MEQTTQKGSTETSMETGIVQVLRLLPPLRTHIPDAEFDSEQYLMQVLYWWDVALCLGDRAFEVVGWYIDVGDWMLFRTHTDDPQCDFFDEEA